mmetsp:Transcript_39870/g.82912  ORF Transcript_39870/g.82912 Transcript_39870/m.82912 type:complete len:175 (-) Transcript_39870:86-610(-)
MGTEVCLYIYFSCFFRRIHGFFLFFQRKCYFLPEEEPPFPLEEEETAFLEFFFLPFCVSSFWSFLPPLLKLGEEEGASVLGLREGSVLEGDSTSKGNDKDSSSKESFGREKVAEHSMFCDSSRRGGSNSMQKQIPGLDNNFLNVVVVKQFESPAAAHPNRCSNDSSNALTGSWA